MNRFLPIFLIVAGIALLGYSTTLPAYSDEEAFIAEYRAMERFESEAYWDMRDRYLTGKYEFEDYGLTLIIGGILMLLAIRFVLFGRSLPSNKFVILGIGAAAVVSTRFAFVLSLFQDHGRGEFPHWADSLGIPMAGLTISTGILAVWAFAHLAFLRPTLPAVRKLDNIKWTVSSVWLALLSTVTLLVFALSAFAGDFWMLVPCALWLYYYLSLLKTKNEEESNHAADPTAVNPQS